MAIDGAAIASSHDGIVVILAGQKADVVDLRNASREELDRPSGDVAFVVAAERRVVGAVELMHIAAVRVRSGQNAVHIPAQCLDPFRQVGHLVGGQDPVEVRTDRDAVVAVEVRELAVRRPRQMLREPSRVA